MTNSISNSNDKLKTFTNLIASPAPMSASPAAAFPMSAAPIAANPAANPAEPKPMFDNNPYGGYDPSGGYSPNSEGTMDTEEHAVAFSNFLYMILGTIFGWLGTFMFYKCS